MSKRKPTPANLFLLLLTLLMGACGSITGKVHKADVGQATSSDPCSKVVVGAAKLIGYYQPPPGTEPGLLLPQYELVKEVNATGNLQQNGFCTYELDGLPTDVGLYVGARYTGTWSQALGGGAVIGEKLGWTDPVSLADQTTLTGKDFKLKALILG